MHSSPFAIVSVVNARGYVAICEKLQMPDDKLQHAHMLAVLIRRIRTTIIIRARNVHTQANAADGRPRFCAIGIGGGSAMKPAMASAIR